MAQRDFYISSDLHGSKRICDTRVSVDSILACLDHGEDPAAIQRAFPVLSLDQIQDTIAYIQLHPREIAEHRELQAAKWSAARAESESRCDPLFTRLRMTQAKRTSKAPSAK
jgi:uncharacterized protein (DUF433 family)